MWTPIRGRGLAHVDRGSKNPIFVDVINGRPLKEFDYVSREAENLNAPLVCFRLNSMHTIPCIGYSPLLDF